MSGKASGPKKKLYNKAPHYHPVKNEVNAFYQRPAEDGGMSPAVMDFERAVRDYRAASAGEPTKLKNVRYDAQGWTSTDLGAVAHVSRPPRDRFELLDRSPLSVCVQAARGAAASSFRGAMLVVRQTSGSGTARYSAH